MFRLQCVRPCLRRLLHHGVGSRDHVLEGLQICSADDQVLDVVGKNRTKLTVEHVSCAVRMLWDFQKERPELLRTVHLIKCHPQFLTLRVLAENKISLMDDLTLVDMLYVFLRLSVEPHDSLVQQMVSEAWRRVDGLPMSSLSKFAVILHDQGLHSSPLMGHITNILDQRLSSIDNARLENTTFLLADEFSAQQALAVVEALEESQSRNLSLLNKITSVIQKKLHVYRSVEVARITQALFLLHYQNPELFAALRTILVSFLQRSFYPFEVTMLTRVLAMLPSPRLDEGVAQHVNNVIAQCNLSELNTISFAVAKWIRTDPSYRHNTHSKYVRLLQRLSQCGRERLQTADQLDLVLDEIKFAPGEWFEEMLLEETFVTLNRMIDQINPSNIADLAFFLTRTNRLNPPLMERIASVAIEHIDEIHFSATYPTLLPFSVLNYEPAHADELYDACIKRFTPHISCFDPHLLVLLAYCLALADHFPEELIREIFSIDFLGKLDCQLESLHDSLKMRTKQRLMELNRAVCLECPEFQVPWFHERYCQHLQKKVNGSVSPVQQQIHTMLGEVLGGINFVRAAVVTPYFYTIDFECKLDKHLKPLPYSGTSTLQISERGKVLWDSNSLENARDELPAGAHRVAIDFMDSKFFCKNTHHMKGEALMRKRHLEILGYRVVQIPHFEWNSMELSTPHAWKRYLRKKILG
ncbi:FAST kinase domain-containing protein 1, mitochondrial isoform X2 [Poecilia reticulata]|uniref:FAST kinase domain-containing protein 1, mitochondrial isoform X2 n=1 Tax=Poecilia reticulata TaxID=8081 RepID=UPI0004A49474|nr:PREDICTED: FAST kinase domain-containing protein 1, mitochondrial isoform X2 [Poecilia reticulata]